jgi:hypothetical protein
MALYANPTLTGNRWKVVISGMVAGAVITFAISNHTATVSQDGDDTEAVIPFASGAEIPGGAGWSGATDQPPQIGTFTHKAIARWNVVPYQVFAGTLKIGVVAFASTEMGRVEFSAENGTWTPIGNMTTNSDSSNTVEYWGIIDAADFADGAVEIRAIAYPVSGVPRVLDSLTLYANSGGTYNAPVRYVSPTGDDGNDGLSAGSPKLDPALALASMNAGGIPANATLYLLPGAHLWKHPSFPNNTIAQQAGPWVNIQAAPGYDKDDVSVTTDLGTYGQPYMMSLSRIRWKEVTFDSGLMPYMAAEGTQVWYDNVKCDGVDRTSPTVAFAFGESPGGKWMTDCIITEMSSGPQGFNLIRNASISATLDGGPWETYGVINTTVTDADPDGTGAHPDIWRSRGTMENVILYNLDTTGGKWGNSQGIVFFTNNGEGGPLYEYDDVAVVNCDINAGLATLALGGVLRNVYFKDCTFDGTCGPDAGEGNYDGDSSVVFENVDYFLNGTPTAAPSFPNATVRD